MELLWLAVAFLLGLGAKAIGLPPLVGYLAGGFLLSGFGAGTSALLHEVAHYGIILLLFTLGLKMRMRNVVQPEVYASGLLQIVISVVILTAAFALFGLAADLGLLTVVLLAVLLSDMSTVIVAKSLQERQEVDSYQGRVAIGITVFDDIVMIAILAIAGLGIPSPWALTLLALPLARPLLRRLLSRRVDEELLILYGLMLAIGGAYYFEFVGLSGELGAFLAGLLIAGHPQVDELADTLWSLREVFLVGFFLEIGLLGIPEFSGVGFALAAVLFIPVRIAVFFGLLTRFRLRARTAFYTATALGSYSEFALIAGAVAIQADLIPEVWLPVVALTIALSFVFAAPVNRASHWLYERLEPILSRFERNVRHPDSPPMTLGHARYLVVGMGRTGTATYDELKRHGESVVGLDSDPGKIERHREAGRRVLYADADDHDLWDHVNVHQLRGVVLAVPDLGNKVRATEALRKRGFEGIITATRMSGDEYDPLEAAGANSICHPFLEAGYRLAEQMLIAQGEPVPVPATGAADD